jgi:hypothetical protein
VARVGAGVVVRLWAAGARTSVGLSPRWMRAYTVSLVDAAMTCGDDMQR